MSILSRMAVCQKQTITNHLTCPFWSHYTTVFYRHLKNSTVRGGFKIQLKILFTFQSGSEFSTEQFPTKLLYLILSDAFNFEWRVAAFHWTSIPHISKVFNLFILTTICCSNSRNSSLASFLICMSTFHRKQKARFPFCSACSSPIFFAEMDHFESKILN